MKIGQKCDNFLITIYTSHLLFYTLKTATSADDNAHEKMPSNLNTVMKTKTVNLAMVKTAMVETTIKSVLE